MKLPMTATEPSTPTVQRSPHLGLAIVTATVNGVQVPVACPTAWCTEKHTIENPRHAEDVDHNSDNVDVYTPNFRTDRDELFAYAHLGQDPYSVDEKTRAAHIRVEDGGGEASYLTPDQGNTFAKNLDTFGSEIRVLAHIARGAEPAVPGHFPWCQPGACVTDDHRGFESSVAAPQFMRAAEGTLLRARLCSDASDGGGATVSLSGSDSNGTILTGDELDPVIDELAAFLDELRAMRLHLKAAKA
jgi:hypothetical protein